MIVGSKIFAGKSSFDSESPYFMVAASEKVLVTGSESNGSSSSTDQLEIGDTVSGDSHVDNVHPYLPLQFPGPQFLHLNVKVKLDLLHPFLASDCISRVVGHTRRTCPQNDHKAGQVGSNLFEEYDDYDPIGTPTPFTPKRPRNNMRPCKTHPVKRRLFVTNVDTSPVQLSKDVNDLRS